MATPVSRLPKSGQLPKLTLADISTKGSGLPNRYILYAVEKWGKTSLGAKFPAPIFLQSRGETGLETLMDAGLLPETPHFPEITDWETALGAVRLLRESDHKYKTLVIDTANGLERLCHEHVCAKYYNSDWGPNGFAAYGRGYESAATEWRMLLTDLDALRMDRKMTILLLFHAEIKTFKNPEGSDYDRYRPAAHDKTWNLTHKWADVVLFGNYEATVQGDSSNVNRKGKAFGGQIRLLYTQRTAAYDAGNRLGLPVEIEMGNSVDDAWQNFSKAVKEARKVNTEVTA